jgi:ABC-type molybdate transport system substrate-binding protein
MRLTRALNLSLCLATALIATVGHAATVTVFAAASLT